MYYNWRSRKNINLVKTHGFYQWKSKNEKKKKKELKAVFLSSFSEMLVPKFEDLIIHPFRRKQRVLTISGTLPEALYSQACHFLPSLQTNCSLTDVIDLSPEESVLELGLSLPVEMNVTERHIWPKNRFHICKHISLSPLGKSSLFPCSALA